MPVKEQERRLGQLPPSVGRKLGLTRLSLLFEALLSAFWPVAALVLAFLALAFSSGLESLAPWLHLAILVGFAVALILLLWRGIARLKLPDAAAVRHRLESGSGLDNRPLTSLLDDQLAAPGDDPVASALYRQHRRRLRDRLADLRVPGPRPVLAALDRNALLPAAGLLFLVGLAAAGGDAWSRLQAAILPGLDTRPAQPVSLEAWLDPPDYSGLAPVYLTASAGETIALPEGSRLIAQVEGLAAQPALRVNQAEEPFETLSPGLHRLETPLTESGSLDIIEGARSLAAWTIDVIPDSPPQVAFLADPGESDRKALVVTYGAEDDYGLDTVEAELLLKDHGMGEALLYTLTAPEGSSAKIEGESYEDLTAHPWAGLPVLLTLLAKDQKGQEGRSETREIILPARVFSHPVAQQIISLRRHLTVAPQVRRPIIQALRGLVDAPDAFGDDLVAALGMITAASRLEHDRREAAIGSVQALLWETALRIEEGDVSLLAQELRDIQERLQEALDNGASEEEIEALLDELEAAMERYLQAMQEEMQRRMERGELPQTLPQDSQMLPRDSLQERLQELRDLNQAGARDLARQRLAELQRMLENLQAQPFAMPDPNAEQTMEQMRALEEMLRRQQDLLDQSHRSMQGNQPPMMEEPGPRPGQRPGEMPQGGQPGDPSLQGNAEAQEQLRRELGQMMRDLAQQLGEVPQNLGRAEQAMRRAGDALEEGDAGRAAGSQREAVEQLRQGLSEMAQRMSPQMGPPREGQGSAPLGSRRTGDQDPLGREAGQGRIDSREDIGIPDAGELTRARELLQELRQRRDDQGRSEEERQYMERLLDFF